MGSEFYLAVIMAGVFALSSLPFLLYYKVSPKPMALLSLWGLFLLLPGALILALLESASFIEALTLNTDSRSSATALVVMPHIMFMSGFITALVVSARKLATRGSASNKSLNTDTSDSGAG